MYIESKLYVLYETSFILKGFDRTLRTCLLCTVFPKRLDSSPASLAPKRLKNELRSPFRSPFMISKNIP